MIYHILPQSEDSMLGAGAIDGKKRFVTHTTLHHSRSAIITLTPAQITIVVALLTSLLTGFWLNFWWMAVGLTAVLSLIYFADMLFNLYLVSKSLHFPPEVSLTDEELAAIDESALPDYTILCPLYKEAAVLPQFVKAIEALDYPKDKLDVQLLLEQDDGATLKAAEELNLPAYFRIMTVPDSLPKTKPKACNFGLNHARGELIVIYDAEDRPDPLQLKKAYLGFSRLGAKVVCLQAKLNYYNPHQNLLTRLFTAEYSLWFDVILPALQSIDTTIPLGGTSNHFRLADLKRLEGWDPFNVAEDADLGVRLFRDGNKTAIIDSLTLEEANSNLGNWIRQRSRWLKGYLQTFLVHSRDPLTFARRHKNHWLIFQLIAGLRISFVLINPLMWLMTLAYFFLNAWAGPAIAALYPAPVFYLAATSAVFGNFLYIYYYMIGAAKRQQWAIIKYVFLVPVYWLLTSIAAVLAVYQLFFKPHFWEKTVHGLAAAKAPNPVPRQYLSGAFLIGSALIANLFNFLFNAYLSRKADLDDFGLISLVGSFVYIISGLLAALSNTVTYRSSYLLGKFKIPVKSFWARTRSKSFKYAVILAGSWLILTPFLMPLFQAKTMLPFIIFVPVLIFGLVAAVDSGWLFGNHKFAVVGAAALVEAAVKLAAAVWLVETGLHDWVYLSLPLSIAIAFLIGWYYAVRIKSSPEKIEASAAAYFPGRFFISSLANKLSTIAFLSLDVILAKIFLSPDAAGHYALLSLVGKMIYFTGSLFTQFITPVIGKREGEGAESVKSFYRLLAVSSLSSLLAYVVLGGFGPVTAPLLFGPKIVSVVHFLPLYGLAILCQTVASSIIAYHQVKHHHLFSYLGLVLALAQFGGLLVWHRNIRDIIEVIFLGGLFYMAAIGLLHIYYGRIWIIIRNLADFLGLFGPGPVKDFEPSGKLRLLIFNWRDRRHVWAGGAEVYLHEIAKRLVKMGHKVTLFCGNDGHCPRNQVIDGVQMVRRGGLYTVYVWACLYYLFRFRRFTDVIIDSENGIPFFTPLYARKPIFLLIHHVHQEVFRLRLKPPLSWLGQFLEKQLMPLVYRNIEVITVSPSSKAGILEHKLTNKDPRVIYSGVDPAVYHPGKKSPRPLVLYLGRLARQKSLEVLIRSARKVINRLPRVEFVIAGAGPDKKRLERLVKQLKLDRWVRFAGRVAEPEKVALYQKAWVFVNPSLIEGWGITTIEANACGTPVVASNVAGLRDAVHNPHSGLLVPYGKVDEFSQSIIRLLRDKTLRQTMSRESIAWAKKFDWDKSSRELLEIL